MARRSLKAQRGERRSPRIVVVVPPQGSSHGKARRYDPPASPEVARKPGQLILYAFAAGAVLGTVMIVLSLLSVGSPAPVPVAGSAGTAQSERRGIGSAEAPVVIVEWMDFQCPACRLFALGREPEIQKRYVDTGKVRIVSRNFAFLGPESILAAEAAEAAADQGRYWDYKTLLYQRQQGENLGVFRAENLKRFAAELGLDQRAFDSALDRGTHRSAVLAEEKEGESLGVKATPTLFINGRKIEGVPAMDQLVKLIEEELAKKQ